MTTELTHAQLTILQSLATKGPQPRMPLMQAAAIGHNTFAKVFESLVYRGLVIDGERQPGRTWCLIEITMAGRRALADLENGTQEHPMRVPAQTRSKLEGFYRPPPAQFCRNNGNMHIPSRGVAC